VYLWPEISARMVAVPWKGQDSPRAALAVGKENQMIRVKGKVADDVHSAQ